MILAALKSLADLWKRYEDFRRDSIVLGVIGLAILLTLAFAPYTVITFAVGVGFGCWATMYLEWL